MKLWLISLLGILFNLQWLQAETLPSRPAYYFNDYAGVISDDIEKQLDAKLQQLEKDTTAQVVVAIYPKMETESSIEDYTFRIAEKWGVGQKGKDNGAVLFIFIQDRKMFLQVGYGLEEKIPDAFAKQIIEYEIKSEFKKGNYDEGLKNGVNAILKVISGEYQPKNFTQKSFRALISELTMVQRIIVIGVYLSMLGGVLATIGVFIYWNIKLLKEIYRQIRFFNPPQVFANRLTNNDQPNSQKGILP